MGKIEQIMHSATNQRRWKKEESKEKWVNRNSIISFFSGWLSIISSLISLLALIRTL